jgi:hypothetical protein
VQGRSPEQRDHAFAKQLRDDGSFALVGTHCGQRNALSSLFVKGIIPNFLKLFAAEIPSLAPEPLFAACQRSERVNSELIFTGLNISRLV